MLFSTLGEHLLSDNSVQPGTQENNSLEFTPVTLQDQSFSFNDTVDQLNIEFNLDEALKLVGLNCSETGESIGPYIYFFFSENQSIICCTWQQDPMLWH